RGGCPRGGALPRTPAAAVGAARARGPRGGGALIGSLRGRLAAKQPPQIILERAGGGYDIETPMATFLELPAIGAELSLHTHLHVREDAQTLFGFSTVEEKQLFRALLKVSGVGARMALAVLSSMTVDDFRRCVRHEDAKALTKVPG